MKFTRDTIIHFPRSEAEDIFGAADTGSNWYVVNKNSLVGRKIGRVGAKHRNYFDEAMAEAARLNAGRSAAPGRRRCAARREERRAEHPAPQPQAQLMHGVTISRGLTFTVDGRTFFSVKDAAQARHELLRLETLKRVAEEIANSLYPDLESKGVFRDDRGNLCLIVEAEEDVVAFLQHYRNTLAPLFTLPSVEQIEADLQAESSKL